MAATVSAWSKPGAWAFDSEEHEAELLQQNPTHDTVKPLADFPSLAVAAATKPKKKKAQTYSLAEFTAKPDTAFADQDPVVLPTGPRQRTAEELDRTRLGGGFRSYGDRPNRNSSGDYSSNSRWGSSRVSHEPRRNGSFGARDSNRELPPSRADETDNWAVAKKPSGGFERRERDRGGFFDSPFKFTWSFSTMPMPSPSFSTRKSPPNICIVKSLFSKTSLSDAVSSLDLLRLKGIRLPSHILATLLRHCSKTRSFREGKLIHLHLKLTGFKRPPTLLANHLIAMYFSCGDFVQARQVFDKMNDRNLFTWNNMLSGYAKLGMMKQARSIFYRMPHKDYVSWNSMVSGYAHRGRFDEALRFYRRFRRLDVGYNEFSFASVLIVSVKLKEFELCRQIHGQVLVVGFLSNVVISSLIIDAYAKCGKMEDARRLFHDMPSRDVRAWTTLVSAYAAWGDIESSAELFSQMPKSNPCSWTSLIRGYSRNGMGHEALGVFREMIKHQVRPDQFTFSTCLLACATIASLKHGKQIHAFLVRNSIKPNTVVISAIVGMYLKCGRLETARRVFNSTGNKQDVELWNMILSTLAHYGYVTDKENGFVVDENSGLTI